MWFELQVRVRVEFAETVANFLVEHGAPGIQMEELPPRCILTAHFEAPPPVAELYDYWRELQEDPGKQISLRATLRTIVSADWATDWMRHFQPLPVGNRFYVCPPWDLSAPADRLRLIIDPGMAFGTGQHPTTRGCLALLERILAARPVRRALDVGTGSGILAIALAKLGVHDVWAIDTDPTARDSAEKNSTQNLVAERVHVEANLDETPGQVELIVANLYADLLVSLAPRFAARLEDSGSVVCSGMLIADMARVRASFETSGFRLLCEVTDGEWATLALEKKSRT